MPRRRHLLAALAAGDFRRLLAVRIAGQFGDGAFQASLAGAVLFNPERQAAAADVAAGFAVLLLPYSLIGPFAGVLLDRWWRQRILIVANTARAGGLLVFAAGIGAGLSGLGFYAAALVLISVARFLLSALSAALPRVVPRAELVTANSFTTTVGTVAAVAGGGAAIGARALLGSGTGDYALIAAAAAVPYLLAAFAAGRFARSRLGPSAHERATRESLREVVRGLAAGLAHVRSRRPVLHGLTVVAVHRLGYGVTTVCTVLLYRNRFDDQGFFRAGLAGLTQVVTMIAVGGALAAAVTPAAFRRFGAPGWPALLLLGAAAVLLSFVLSYRLPLLLVAALLLGFAAQGVKISVDTLVQQYVDDAFRGRVFALYDTLFNVTLVVAAVLTATVLPADGHSPASVVVIAVGYVVAAACYARLAVATRPSGASVTPG
ncbi:MFS-type transporter involved in bile tolerance, Atg22 family [Jatrophihabitans endophyticus]|uniref:MFS-type transporter involved in bile tolerance, Atg22 family n=1 Tax=Jatrophihabitans endophyticus TaxID=1206085 RepID=A0A1M5HU85_9ACTN|nr:MFS transporter [Jatrophihabitans endophyticus]SHG19524.1 MFS-type transporter involved in bile tolerance, Atg22 family [Jatrophihabitans endophyticus]